MKIIKPFYDYYDILNLQQDAGKEEIRQRYLEIAQQFHPDRLAKASRKEKQYFQTVSEAYSVLKNSQKRSQYDKKREIYLSRRKNRINRGNWLRSLFTKSAGKIEEDHDQEKPVIIPLRIQKLESLYGGKKTITVKYKRSCPYLLSGTHKDQGPNCSTCGGDNYVQEQKKLTLLLPPGLKEGQKLRLSRDKFPQLRGCNSPILLELQIEHDSNIQLHGLNVVYTYPVDFEKMLMGEVVSVHFNNKRYRIQLPSSQTSLENSIQIPGEGIKMGEKSGDLIVRLVMRFPSSLSQEQKALLKQFSSISKKNNGLQSRLKKGE